MHILSDWTNSIVTKFRPRETSINALIIDLFSRFSVTLLIGNLCRNEEFKLAYIAWSTAHYTNISTIYKLSFALIRKMPKNCRNPYILEATSIPIMI